MRRIVLGILLSFAIVSTALIQDGKEEKRQQRLVSIYQFGCLIEVSKNDKTYAEFLVDEFGHEDRTHGKVIAPVVILPLQGKGQTPSPCAYTD